MNIYHNSLQIEIITPFSSQNHLDDMRLYLNKVSSEMNNKIIANPVHFSNFAQEDMKEKLAPPIHGDEPSSKMQPSEHENAWKTAISNNLNDFEEETKKKNDMYKRLSRTLPVGL